MRDNDNAVPSEMQIVDAFSHVIFCGAEELTPEEEGILRTLCVVDENAATASAGTFPGDVGSYLKALDVSEMIQLVSRVRDCYLHPGSRRVKTRSHAGERRPSRF